MRVVVIGSGLAGVTLAEGLKAHDVSLVTAETVGYYPRPRLSHGVSIGEVDLVMRRFERLPFRVLAGAEAWLIERDRRRLVLADGRVLDYDALVLATGSASRIPPVLAPSRAHFLTLNSYEDLLQLRRRRAQVLSHGRQARWAVIGGGLIGCELASDLRKAGDSVTILHREQRLIELQLDEEQSRALHEHFARHGVEVRYGQDVCAVFPGGVQTAAGELGPFDGVVVSTGFAPRIELAQEAGLPTARGIVVNEYLHTRDPAIYALGDVAEIAGRLYPFVSPIRSQALWLAQWLERSIDAPWKPPAFTPVIKIHGFKLEHAPVGTSLAA